MRNNQRSRDFAERIEAVRQYMEGNPEHGRCRIAKALGISQGAVQRAMLVISGKKKSASAPDGGLVPPGNGEQFAHEETDTGAVLSSRSATIRSKDQLLEAAKVDLTIWEVEKYRVNRWEVVMREPATTVGGAGRDAVISTSNSGAKSTLWTRASSQPVREELWKVDVWLRRKNPKVVATESLIRRLEKSAPALYVPAIRRRRLSSRRALEVCIMDPHVGLLCEKPEADAAWGIDIAEAAIMGSIHDLVDKANRFGPFEQVFLPFGNDFVHSDNVFHTTTAGTGQPESVAWHHVYERAENIAIRMIDDLRAVAKEVFVYEVPGNHSRMCDFTLAHTLRAYYRKDKNVHVDASSSPYKFHRYGATLIGYEHGHSVSPIRLAALMANERGRDFSECHYREWHLGDQHRKGSSNPAAFEEQGVSVEFIPGLTAPNEWHRLKGFNHQKRGAMAWVYDYETGPICRLQHNLFGR